MSSTKYSFKFVMPYHNNLYDTVQALQTIADVEILSPKNTNRVIYAKDNIKITSVKTHRFLTRIYSPLNLWQKISPQTTHVFIKGKQLPENIIPVSIAFLRGAKIISFSSNAMLNKIPTCVNPQRFSPKNYSVLSPQKLRIVTIAKYQPRKNLPLLISTLATLKQNHPLLTFSLDLIGVLGEKAEYANLQKVIRANNLENQVTLHLEVPHQKTIELLTNSDLFVLPASKEPLGYATLEAMAVGLPVVITDEVGAKLTVQNNQNGYIIKPKSITSLTTAIQQFITRQSINTIKLQSFGQASQQIINTWHTPQIFLHKIKPLL